MEAEQRIQDNGGTPEALIAAARDLFTRHGYDGASVRAITNAAGANLGAVTYHFGSKQALYERVVESCVAPLAARVEQVAHGGGTPMDRVAGVVQAYFDHLTANPDIARLIVQALVVPSTPPEGFYRFVRRIHGLLVEIVLAGQRDGSMRAGNPVQMAVGIVSHPLHLMLLRPPLKAVLGWDLEDPATQRDALQGAIDFACGGLAARPHDPPGADP